MPSLSCKVMVLCSNPGRLIEYSVLLNRLQLFKLNLCTDFNEVQKALVKQNHYELFIHADFTPEAGTLSRLQSMNRENSFGQLVLIGETTDLEKEQLYQWAWDNRIPLLRVLNHPVTFAKFRELIDSLVFYRVRDLDVLSLARNSMTPINSFPEFCRNISKA
ncbi:hypothetical protein D9M71_487440 [compost metagenome]